MKTVWKTTLVALGVFLSAMALGALFQTPEAKAQNANINGRPFTQSIVPTPICDQEAVDQIVADVTRVIRITGEEDSQKILNSINETLNLASEFPFKWSQVDFYRTEGTDRSLMFVYAKNPETAENCLIYYNDMLTLDEVQEITKRVTFSRIGSTLQEMQDILKGGN